MICQRCTKNVSPEGVHTCTPTAGWRALEARIAELEAERDNFHMEYRMKCDVETKQLHEKLAALRRKIDEAPVVAWLCEGEDIYGEYYCYVVSATPPDQDHVTIKPLISRGDLQG